MTADFHPTLPGSCVLGCGCDSRSFVSSHDNSVSEVGTAVPISQMRELRHREVKSPAGCLHSEGKDGWGLNPTSFKF